MILAALAAAATLSQASPPASPASGLSGAETLEPVFHLLSRAKGSKGPPVVILQLGDSHSAADHISGALRARLQASFGEGGRGVLPPGKPFKLFSTRQVEMKQSDGWRLEAGFLPANVAAQSAGDPAGARPGPGPYGLAGFRLTSTRPGATLSLHADPEAAFDRVAVCALASPGAGDITIRTADGLRSFATSATTTGPLCRGFDLPAKATEVELATAGGPVSLFSFGAFRSGGVSLSNLGVIGARIDEFAARDDAVLAAELAEYRPQLILLAFGTNDGFQTQVDGEAYRALFQGQIQRLKRLAPQADLLVMGPPDADTSRPDIPLDGVHNLGFGCTPLSQSETAAYGDLVKQADPGLARWYPPPALAVVREAQRQAAKAEGVAFWDWRARMGGDCSAHSLAHAYEPLMRGDHVHFNSGGGDFVAGLLWHDLMAAYDAPGGH